METTTEQQIDLMVAEAERDVENFRKAQRSHDVAMLCAKYAADNSDNIVAAYNAAFKAVMEANHG